MTGDLLEQEGGPTGATGGLSENTPRNPRQPLRGMAEAFSIEDYESAVGDLAVDFTVHRHPFTEGHRRELLALLGLEA